MTFGTLVGFGRIDVSQLISLEKLDMNMNMIHTFTKSQSCGSLYF